MGKIGCTIDGNLDDSKFSDPMPWIGMYVAAASAACALSMAMDTLHGLRRRIFWFPCYYFSLNATTLTLLAVATKLSVDLNTSMPRPQDQLAKLSSAALICTVIANFMPSLGLMENKELLMNKMALGIFVITAIVNIGIQLATGVIYVFCKEHIALMFLMLVLLLQLISSAVAIPTTKSYLNLLRVISMKCHHSTIEKRAKGVHSAILLLGKAESTLEILRSQPLPNSAPDKLAKIDHWRTHSKVVDYLSCSSNSSSNDTPTSQSSSDLYLTVE